MTGNNTTPPLSRILEFERARKFREAIRFSESLLRSTSDKNSKGRVNLRLGWLYDQLAITKKGLKKAQLQKKSLYHFRRAAPLFSAEAFRGIGTVYHHRYKHRKAIEYYKKANSIDPNPNLYYNSLGNVYQRIGLREKKDNYLKKALTQYQKALKHSKSKKDKLIPLANAALVLQHLNRHSDACKYAEKALKISRENYAINDIKEELKSLLQKRD